MEGFKNKVIQGDCLEVMKQMPNKSVDLILTSPPYNMRLRIRNGKYITRENTKHFSKKYEHFDDAIPIEEFYSFHKKCITEMLRISKIVVYNFQIVTGSKEAFFKLIGDFSNEIKDIIIWDKGFGQPAMSEKVLNAAYEFLLILEDNNKKGRKIQNSFFKRGTLQNIFRIKRELSKSRSHGAVFPKELVEKVITNFSQENDIVLDPFAGSGTTGIVAQSLKRNYILIEQQPEYIELIKERFSAH